MIRLGIMLSILDRPVSILKFLGRTLVQRLARDVLHQLVQLGCRVAIAEPYPSLSSIEDIELMFSPANPSLLI